MTSHQPRKSAQQGRAKATMAAIVEAAARLLETQGGARLTTNHVAELAGVSIGTLYQYYPNKEAVIAAVLRREKAALLAGFEDIIARGLGPKSTIDALIDATLAHQYTRPRLALALEYIEPELGLLVEDHARDRRLVALVAQVVIEVAPDADARAAQDLVAICRAITNTAAMSGETDPTAIAPRLHRAVSGYLGLHA
ncbi:transcriptional regulator, TetR family [Yoonia tamlensis]|uniref:Transcriptional regulator, TetR family n=1 Tax=Yoonia tamlensis TaxID=390270 RepID=A0A1I6FU74_9RHOB|nr:TetR/AcrR family transcriptional regulator [Yoonia tamlensis]SFR33502.1 transcriptional regulator, TetR family [Yoonia tamlensis]